MQKFKSAIVPSHDATAVDDSDGIDIGGPNDHFRVIYATKFDGALGGKHGNRLLNWILVQNITITGNDFEVMENLKTMKIILFLSLVKIIMRFR